MSLPKICVIGLGYIGLPTAAMFASRGLSVIGVDINKSTVNTINAGRIHIAEPELDAVVDKAVGHGYLRASLTPEIADAFLIAVPTPIEFHDDGDRREAKPNLRYIQEAAKSIASGLPIACSNMSSMPELLGENAVYFNPLDINGIENSIRKLIDSEKQRTSMTRKTYQHLRNYSWDETAFKTFNFFKEILE